MYACIIMHDCRIIDHGLRSHNFIIVHVQHVVCMPYCAADREHVSPRSRKVHVCGQAKSNTTIYNSVIYNYLIETTMHMQK